MIVVNEHEQTLEEKQVNTELQQPVGTSAYHVLAVGSRLGVYGTAAMVNFCRPLPPIRNAKPPWGTLELTKEQHVKK